MKLRAYVRMGGAGARLLLVAVLALGVYAMHTQGHPDPAATAHSAPMAEAAPGGHPAPGGYEAPGAYEAPGGHEAAAGDAPAAGGALPVVLAVGDPGDGMGMDMGSVCLAVLAGWALAVVLLAAFARDRAAAAPLPGADTAALRPRAPPPRPPDLAQLSVLRI